MKLRTLVPKAVMGASLLLGCQCSHGSGGSSVTPSVPVALREILVKDAASLAFLGNSMDGISYVTIVAPLADILVLADFQAGVVTPQTWELRGAYEISDGTAAPLPGTSFAATVTVDDQRFSHWHLTGNLVKGGAVTTVDVDNIRSLKPSNQKITAADLHAINGLAKANLSLDE